MYRWAKENAVRRYKAGESRRLLEEQLEHYVPTLCSCQGPSHKPTSLPLINGETGNTRAQKPVPSCQKDGVLGVAQLTLHVSIVLGSRRSCGQLGAVPEGQGPKEVGGTSSCCLGPLGGHSQSCQPCRSSSSQTIRVIFSQRFNTSQLAGVQGGSPPPPSPPRRQARPIAYAAAASASLFVYLVVSAWLLFTPPQEYDPGKRKPKNWGRLIKGPRVKIKKVQTWKVQQPLQTPTLPQLCDWQEQRRGGSGLHQRPGPPAAPVD